MILIFDTSIEGFSVGLLDINGIVIHQINNVIPYSHTQFLVPSINQIMSACNIQFQDLTKIITTNGPGSFTGIRVGLATAAGLQAALNCPVVTVSTLAALTYAGINQRLNTLGYIHTVLDTKCGEVYHQAYKYENENLMAMTQPRSVSVLTLKQELGPEDVVIAPLSSSTALQEIAHEIVHMTLFNIWQAASNIQPSNLQPLYVRPATVTCPRN